MKCNVGGWDRRVRLAAGAAALGIGLFGRLSSRRRALVLGIGAIPLGTGLTRYCPLNGALGINTCEPSARLKHALAELG